jgi:hypothetical protein
MVDSEALVVGGTVALGLLVAAVGLPLTCTTGAYVSANPLPEADAESAIQAGDLDEAARSTFETAVESDGAYLESAPAAFSSPLRVTDGRRVYRVETSRTVDCSTGAAPAVVALSGFLVVFGAVTALVD